MKRDYEQLSPEALLLNRYLSQYKVGIRAKKNLELRLREIMYEFESPLSAIKMDGMPHGSSEGTGCAALTLRLDEIETKINLQIDKTMKVLTDIMDAIDLLPDHTIERAIIEHRYVDRLSWDKICARVSISRTPAIRYWRKGLYMLLEQDSIQKALKEYKDELDDDTFF